MAGRRWAQGSSPESSGKRDKPRPSERAGGQAGAAPGKGSSRPGGAPAAGTRQPSPEVMARARARLEPPKALWHPLPLAELGIVIGALAMVASALTSNGDGLAAGFVLIMLGTGEFSWREHRHGYRSHGAVLSAIVAFAVGFFCWRVIGVHRNACLVIGGVVFAFAWGLFDRAYVPASRREAPPV